MPETRPRSADYALNALHRQRQIARKWGLIALLVGLAIGALAAPNTTLLLFLALLVFGLFGGAVAWALRLFSRWFGQPKSG